MDSSELSTFHRSLTVVDGHCDIPLMVNRLADAAGSTPALHETPLGRAIRAGSVDYRSPDRPPGENAHKVVREIPTHAELPVLTEALLRRGYSRSDVARLMGDNWLDFLARALP